MNLEKVTGKNVMKKTYNRATEEGCAIFVSKLLVLGALLAHFHNILELNIKMQLQLFH
jgi:hypothetical protein